MAQPQRFNSGDRVAFRYAPELPSWLAQNQGVIESWVSDPLMGERYIVRLDGGPAVSVYNPDVLKLIEERTPSP